MPENTLSREFSTTQLLDTIEASVISMKTNELRGVVLQAVKTFEYRKMVVYSIAAAHLADQTHWNTAESTRAQCIALYHMYLMFYSDSRCRECRGFLEKIMLRYQSTLRTHTS